VTASTQFDRCVFINCPFDPAFARLLRPLVFCIMDVGLEPRLALERLDSAESRLEKIVELIEGSKYGIHDLSRLRAAKPGEYYRLNMPFELGLDIGCRRFKGTQWSDKSILVLEKESFAYQAALSDIAGSDIRVHHNRPTAMVSVVREWLDGQAKLGAHGPSLIWDRFNEFTAASYDQLTARGFSDGDIKRLSLRELMDGMRHWIAENPSPGIP
jgi:hypothetical protein